MTGDLFGAAPRAPGARFAPPPGAPLAERMRPRRLDELVGQEKELGPTAPLRRLIEKDRLPSLLLWGPPGSGKTSLARLLATTSGADFEPLSAVLAGVKDVREVTARAKDRLWRNPDGSRRTLLFLDEIHRFNSAQQDALLPHVEDGTIILVGATTENPSFHVTSPLLSRCRLVVLQRLDDDALGVLVDRALADPERGVGERGLGVTDEARTALIGLADGDGRALLNLLETATEAADDGAMLDVEEIRSAAGARRPHYDRAGDAHYGLASALQKSIRSGDVQAGLYWAVRMLESGEDPRFVLRRLLVMASEDVGMAQPSALAVVAAARDAVEVLGMPEGGMAVLQAVVVLASAPKSNALAKAWHGLRDEVRATGSLPVPVHLRPAATGTLRSLGWGAGYEYAHDRPGHMVSHENLPEELVGSAWFEPGESAREQEIARHLERLRAFRREHGGEGEA